MPSNYKCDHCGHLRSCERTTWGDMFCEDCEGMRAEHGGRHPEPENPIKKPHNYDRGKLAPVFKRKQTTCSLCDKQGHNKRTCPTK